MTSYSLMWGINQPPLPPLQLVSEAISTKSTRQNTLNLPKNKAGPWCCPLSNRNWPWLLLQKKKPMFSVEGVTQRLVQFIAANDQVSFSHLSLILLLIILLGLVFKCCQEHWVLKSADVFSWWLWKWGHASSFQNPCCDNWNLAGLVYAIKDWVEGIFLPCWKFCMTLMHRTSEFCWSTPLYIRYLVWLVSSVLYLCDRPLDSIREACRATKPCVEVIASCVPSNHWTAHWKEDCWSYL